ncbi:hypothetical protein [Salinithrix halophila]|uniref:DUF4233 domain-containing protein n=1 Tax=Salinithrix halophila TaxID=1485204 RepID=A0ABV8JCG4_9BACL
MSAARIMKWITGGLEALLGIPILGGLIVLGGSYAPLGVMLLLHIITLIISSSRKVDKHGSILGIITSCLAWIPIVGWLLHMITAVILLVNASKPEPADKERTD